MYTKLYNGECFLQGIHHFLVFLKTMVAYYKTYIGRNYFRNYGNPTGTDGEKK